MITLLKTKNNKNPSLTFGDPISNTYIQIAKILKRTTYLPSSKANKSSAAPAPSPAPAPSLREQLPRPTLHHKPTTEPAPSPGTKHTPNSAHNTTSVQEPRM